MVIQIIVANLFFSVENCMPPHEIHAFGNGVKWMSAHVRYQPWKVKSAVHRTGTLLVASVQVSQDWGSISSYPPLAVWSTVRSVILLACVPPSLQDFHLTLMQLKQWLSNYSLSKNNKNLNGGSGLMVTGLKLVWEGSGLKTFKLHWFIDQCEMLAPAEF